MDKNNKILIINTHPNLDGKNNHGDIKPSYANRMMLDLFANEPRFDIHPIADAYPKYDINIKAEQEKLILFDTIVMMGPIYWYGLPAIAKLWIDTVLTYNWAYGRSGNHLAGKDFHLVLTSGSQIQEYTHNVIGNTIPELFAPLRKTVEYCKMNWIKIHFMGGLSNNHTTHQENSIVNAKISSFVDNLKSDLLS